MKSLCGVLAALLLLGCEAPTVPPPTAVSPAPSPAPAAAEVPAPSSAEGVLRAAIVSRAAVAFAYSGVSRVALPHRLGPSAAGNGKGLQGRVPDVDFQETVKGQMNE